MKLNLLSTRAETNTNIREYSIVLVVLANTVLVANTNLVANTRYIYSIKEFLYKNSSVKVIKCTFIHSINLKS